MSRKIFVLLVLTLVGALAVTFVGISGDEYGDSNPQPQYGGNFQVALTSGTDYVDPARCTSTSGFKFLSHITETLFYMSAEGEILPHLAKDFELSDDELTWTFHLREDVEFHDGTLFDAEAAAFTLERFLNPEMGAVYKDLLLGPVTEVEVAGEYTLKIHTERPFAPLLTNLTYYPLGMVSPTSTKEAGPIGTILEEPVGTGPFMFREWTPDDRMVMVRNDNYWGEGPYLDQVNWRIIPEGPTRARMLEVGDVHLATLTPIEAERLKPREDIDVNVITGWTTRWLAVNHLVEPFDDLRVRKAISYAIDWDAIVNDLLRGVGQVADAPIAPGLFAYTPIETPEYDPEKAEQLLAEAGYPDGFESHLVYPEGIYLMMDEMAQLWQSNLADVGIDISLEVMEWGTFLKALTDQNPEDPDTWYEMWKLSWTAATGDPDHILYPVFHSDEWAPKGPNRHFYKNERVDELLDAGRTTTEPEEREEIYAELTEILVEDRAVILGYFGADSEGLRSNVEGVVLRPSWYHDLSKAWIKN